MTRHVIQVRDLVSDLLRQRQEAPVVFDASGHGFNFDRVRKTDHGVVEVLGITSDGYESLQEQYDELEQLEGRATAFLERFDKIMSGEVAKTPGAFNKVLDTLHEKVKTHLKHR